MTYPGYIYPKYSRGTIKFKGLYGLLEIQPSKYFDEKMYVDLNDKSPHE